MDIMESQDTSTTQESTQRKRSRKKTSRCWESFELLSTSNGKHYAKCKKCAKEFHYASTSGTRNLVQHHDSCQGSGLSPRSATQCSTFSYARFCELVIQAVVKHDLSFRFVEYEGIRAIFDYISPELRLPGRNTVKNHITRLYETEKSKMQVCLSKVKGRICLTSDLWSSHTTDGYLSLKAHFIDSEWKLQKKLLNFCHMPPPHTGSALAEKINYLICEWRIDKNLFSITLDNASANNSFVDMLKTQLNLRKLLLLNEQFFHVRCCAHILNLIVQDGLKVIDDSVVKVRESIKYIKGSMARKHRFFECAQQVGLTKNRRALRQDVPTRWNSTYHMLDSALYYHQAFGQYVLAEPDFLTCPTYEEWDRIKTISKFLADFYEVTTLFSGTKYATSNLFFPRVFKIQYSIKEAMSSENEFIRKMGNEMNAKFQKYWSDYSMTLGIAVVMDPRYKMRFVVWAYNRLYGMGSSQLVIFKNTLDSLYETYVLRWSTEANLKDQTYEVCTSSQEAEELFQDFDASCIEGTSSCAKNELASYLDDKNLERKLDIDILDWWNKEQCKYPVLSRLARDMLTIPVSTVASESAFSIGGRVLDHCRSSLLPETVEALLCVRDWSFEKKCEGSIDMDILAEDILDLNITQDMETA